MHGRLPLALPCVVSGLCSAYQLPSEQSQIRALYRRSPSVLRARGLHGGHARRHAVSKLQRRGDKDKDKPWDIEMGPRPTPQPTQDAGSSSSHPPGAPGDTPPAHLKPHQEGIVTGVPVRAGDRASGSPTAMSHAGGSAASERELAWHRQQEAAWQRHREARQRAEIEGLLETHRVPAHTARGQRDYWALSSERGRGRRAKLARLMGLHTTAFGPRAGREGPLPHGGDDQAATIQTMRRWRVPRDKLPAMARLPPNAHEAWAKSQFKGRAKTATVIAGSAVGGLGLITTAFVAPLASGAAG